MIEYSKFSEATKGLVALPSMVIPAKNKGRIPKDPPFANKKG
jgi:hypothetical protein